MSAATPNPAELEFVLPLDTSGIDVLRRDGYDLYRGPTDALVPLIVFVHGPVRGAGKRPRDWPVYRGYASLAANAGVCGAVLDLDYSDVRALARPEARLRELLDHVREEQCADSDRVAIWAFSGGARLMGRWLEDPPAWLKVVALTYPVVPALKHVVTPVVLTRVGVENPAIQATVDRLLEVVRPAELLNVSRGHHGFDMLDHDDDSKQAVLAALRAVLRFLV